MAFKLDTFKEVTQVTTKQDPTLGIMKWGENNAFPQTVKNLVEQSPNGKAAVKRTAKFYKGAGFEGEDTIVNNMGMSLKDIVSHCADEYAMFEGICLQCSYNLKGQVTSIVPMGWTEARFNEFDELYYASKIGYHPDFGSNSEVQKTIRKNALKSNIKWFDRFNPAFVIDQINLTKGGVKCYNGQVLAYSNAGMSKYPIPVLQSIINYILSDVENSILVRKETATGFINSYILKTTMDSEDPSLIAMETALAQAQGARGYGKIVTFSGLTPEEVQGTLLEAIDGGASNKVIDSAQATFNLGREAIAGAFLIPKILVGGDQSTGFTTTELEDAYYVFNAITQEGRDTIENQINKILKHSVFNVGPIKINKLKLDADEEEPVEGEEPNVPTE